MKGKFPAKLYNFTLNGRNLRSLHKDILSVRINGAIVLI